MFSVPGFVLSFIFGGIGLGIFVYGKRQARWLLILLGLALMIYPYFVSSWALMLIIGALLTAGAATVGWLHLDL